jgi:hypothetical protein
LKAPAPFGNNSDLAGEPVRGTCGPLLWVTPALREDAHRARTGNGPAVFATLRNTSIGYHRSNGETNIARATRRANRRSMDLIDAVTRSDPTTQ